MSIRTLRSQFGTAVLLFSLSHIPVVAQDAPAAPANVVPQGTVVLIQLSDRLDTKTVKTGDHFRARLAESLVAANGQTIESHHRIRKKDQGTCERRRTRVAHENHFEF